MIDLGQHANYIIMAYAGTALVVLGLIVTTLFNTRKQRTKLAKLEQAGILRRSANETKESGDQ